MNDTKENIIIKALHYFAENDYQGSSLNSIAKALNITKGGIYHYFGSKDELFKESILYCFERLGNSLVLSVEKTRSIEGLIRGVFSFGSMGQYAADLLGVPSLGEGMNFMYLMFVGMKKFPPIKDALARMYRESRKQLEFALLSARKAGEIRSDLDCSILALEITAAGEGLILLTSVDSAMDSIDWGKKMADAIWERIKA